MLQVRSSSGLSCATALSFKLWFCFLVKGHSFSRRTAVAGEERFFTGQGSASSSVFCKLNEIKRFIVEKCTFTVGLNGTKCHWIYKHNWRADFQNSLSVCWDCSGNTTIGVFLLFLLYIRPKLTQSWIKQYKIKTHSITRQLVSCHQFTWKLFTLYVLNKCAQTKMCRSSTSETVKVSCKNDFLKGKTSKTQEKSAFGPSEIWKFALVLLEGL